MEKYILMIDDDVDDFLFLNESLKNFPNLRCHYACDGPTGIDMMLKHRPMAVMLDMNMPGLNGLECLKKIKSVAPVADIPVVIFSTCISDGLSKLAISSGATACLKKPSTIENFELIIKQLLAIISTDTPQKA